MKNIIHWNKQKKIWVCHSYKGCSWASVLLINGPWHTEVRPTKPTNPRGWIVTDSAFVHVNPSIEFLENYEKTERLLYDKEKIGFNQTKGNTLLFDKEGCFLLRKKEELNEFYT